MATCVHEVSLVFIRVYIHNFGYKGREREKREYRRRTVERKRQRQRHGKMFEMSGMRIDLHFKCTFSSAATQSMRVKVELMVFNCIGL